MNRGLGAALLILALLILPMRAQEEAGKERTQEPGAEASEGKSYSKKEAYRASADKIILHHGENIRDVRVIAELLSERGYPAEALLGGPDGGVQIFALRSHSNTTYTQEDLDGGTLAVRAMAAYEAMRKKKRATSPQPPEPTKHVFSRKEAYRASTDKIILHYGEGIRGVEEIAFILNERGYPAEAARGGPEDGVNIFALRSFEKTVYNQDQVFGGDVAGHAMGAYDSIMEKRAETHDAKDSTKLPQ